jgi:2-hydroxychromene-2-carboxylate isomerase
MRRAVDYYFSVASPWAFLGSERFIGMARRTDAVINVRPVDLSRVLAASGGLPYQQRAAQRASYRQVDLARWRDRLGIPLKLEPKFYPVDRESGSRMVVAACALGQLAALELSHAILRAIWQEDRDIANWQTLAAVAREAGFNGTALVDAARRPEIVHAWQCNTDLAIEAGVFGVPTWVVEGERFWGQDRLGFLEEKLAA